MRAGWLVGLGIMCCIFALTGHAQFRERLGNPTVAVEVEHPPELGLIVDRLVFGPVRGDCTDELVHRIVGGLASSGLPVADESRRHTRLTQYERNFRDRVDQAAAVERGRFSGGANVAAMVALDVRRCTVETKFSEDEAKAAVPREDAPGEKTYRLRARAFLDFSLPTINLTTGAVLGDRPFSYSGEKREDFASQDGYPDAPAALEMLDEELDEAIERIRRLFLPRTEAINTLFYDDRDCGLRDAYRVLRRGDLGQALAVSEQNLASCERKPNVERKLLARAHYNVGIAHLLRRDYDAALAALHTAEQLRSSGIMREGIATARKAKEMAASMMALRRQAPAGVYRSRDAETLRNADVVRMARQGVPTSVILSMVHRSGHDFDTSTPAIIALNNEGIDEEIIKAMLTAD